ncbi:MAG: glucose 1-dehydrogenase [Deltaproteobacteria bacterium]|jgi:NAD(P)-dependent dehydrogenase (short-subunit alcohol dehydrogenase family)|nr:glucose 1-dehydrogenase [Deltaproteobacteria bacterium]MBT4527925.1 glucose 1-dehydrogenase [Deltaproteobacteria bacterium]
MQASSLLNIEGKVAVITGASSGIGLASAQLLAQMGVSVALLDVNEKQGKIEANNIVQNGGKAIFYYCNVTSAQDCESTAQKVFEAFGQINILFNNAGVIKRKSVLELEEKDWDLVIDVSLKGAYLLSKYVIPFMIKSGGGSIINTGSGWGLKGGDNAVAYCAAKGGVVNMTRGMAIDHGKAGIRVNSVSPGDINTPLLRDEAAQLGADETEFMKDAADRPLNRVGEPIDIAKAVLFLASDLSVWITGTSLLVDGGGLA